MHRYFIRSLKLKADAWPQLIQTMQSVIALAILLYIGSGCRSTAPTTVDVSACAVVPTDAQIEYQQMEMIGFVHFTTNTFTNREWGFGDENPAIFNPTDLDVAQWALVAKNAGLRQLILTAKHHDGFCLWPSKYTQHSILNSPYKNGQGDIVRECVEACHKHDLKVGLYLSPWDRNRADYGQASYVTYYQNQLVELLTNYGPINEIWFDGANGGDGYYGGANETRKIDAKTYYRWEETFDLVKNLQPNIKIFSDAGPDIRWIGNEEGHAGVTFWSTITRDSVTIGKSDPSYLNTGDQDGKNWVVGQCDVSIRPGWFYHSAEDSLVKSKDQLMDIYLKSVGRNAVLLLNIPPNQEGKFHDIDVRNIQEFRDLVDKTFANNLAKNATVSATNQRFNHEKYSPSNLIDTELLNKYWATDDTVTKASIVVDLPQEVEVNYLLLQEPIQLGQRITSFTLDTYTDHGWQEVAHGTTVGYKRIMKIDPLRTKRIRVNILGATNTIALSNIELY